ncbi:ATP/GTP-binding protein [Kitasatospora sp. NPDC086791]|uniref:ATP/GTP-binding protein n=1 Tax=Kitasatospora sp. NPDC086791 TaxID=3155178 RepID=UPI003448A265
MTSPTTPPTHAPATPGGTHDDGALPAVVHAVHEAVLWLGDAADWTGAHLPLLLAVAAPFAIAAGILHWRLTRKALASRTRYTLTPSPDFEPGEEHLWRYAAVILRAANAGPWWAPRAGRSARIRFRADGSVPLEMSVEASSAAKHLLRTSQYPGVTITKAEPVKDKERTHVVRAEFVLAGSDTKQLRNVPMIPDPLQGIVDAVADISTAAGDLAELCLDVQRLPRWQLLMKRWQVTQEAREQQRARAKKEARQAAADAAELEDSWQHQLALLLEPGAAPRRLPALPPRTKPLETEKVLGRLASRDRALLRVQLMVRCASDEEGRAEQRMARLAAALDVFGGGNTWVEDARSFMKWRWTAGSWHRRRGFDERWASARVAPRKQSIVHVGELHGLLKPVTMHCALPVIASELETYEPGKDLVPQGIHRMPDGTRRNVGVPVKDYFFSLRVGKSRYGKTEMAEVQALALAMAGYGVGFIDPHGDSWGHVAPYLAHESLRDRVWRVDLTGRSALVPTWNPLGMERGQQPHEVVTAVVDGLAVAMNWDNANAPRGLTILMKAAEALVAYNRYAVRQQAPEAQATVFQIPALLENEAFRTRVLACLPGGQRQWWLTTFKTIDPSAFAVIINPLTRLASDPVALAFLGSPTSGYDARAAMDESKLLWICPAGAGPTAALLTSLLVNDLFRAARSREDLPLHERALFHLFVDELISFDKATGGILAAFTEQLGKFGLRAHMMTQLLERVSQNTRQSILQNASALSSTAGSTSAVRLVAAEWHDKVDPSRIATLPKYSYYASMTVDGRTVGPILLQGMQVDVVFKDLRTPKEIDTLYAAAGRAVGSGHRDRLGREAGYRQGIVAYFARHGKMPTGEELKRIIAAAEAMTTPATGSTKQPVKPAPATAGATNTRPVELTKQPAAVTNAAPDSAAPDPGEWGEAPPEDDDPFEEPAQDGGGQQSAGEGGAVTPVAP